jgi:predicted alpha/beta hydrolase
VSEPYLQEFVDLPTSRGIAYRVGLHSYPDPGPSAPVVVLWPAMGAPAGFYRPFAQALGVAGIAVIVADLRGTGASTPRPSRADTYGYLDLASDIGTVIDALKPRLDGRRYYLAGHSLGAQLCVLHLATSSREDGPAGLILAAVGLPWYRSYPRPRRYGVLAMSQGIVAITALNRVWPGWAFGGRAARRVMLDWGRTARLGRYPLVDGGAPDLGRIRTPTLAISIEGDPLTPHPTLDHLCGLLSAAPIERVRLDIGAGRTGSILDPGNAHFAWVRKPEAVAEQVVRFVI